MIPLNPYIKNNLPTLQKLIDTIEKVHPSINECSDCEDLLSRIDAVSPKPKKEPRIRVIGQLDPCNITKVYSEVTLKGTIQTYIRAKGAPQAIRITNHQLKMGLIDGGSTRYEIMDKGEKTLSLRSIKSV